MILGNVETLVNDLWHGFDIGTEFFLGGDKAKAIFVGDEVDGQAKVSEATGAAYSVEVGLGGFWEVKVYDNIHGLNVDASCEKV